MTTLSSLMTDPRVVVEDFLIPSDTAGIQLALRRKRPATMTQFTGDRTILLMHGATYSSGSLYDVPFHGTSVMDHLAMSGYDVYALDVRGYGRSSSLPEMAEPEERNPPLVRTEVAVRDLATAVDYICRKSDGQPLNLFAMSWGGSVAGAYTSRNNRNIRKLATLAPQWVSEKTPRIDTGGPIHAYRTVRPGLVRESWLAGVPADKQQGLIPDGWFEQWVKATLDVDGQTPGEKSLRVPAGAVYDVREHWAAAKPLYNPGDITAPVLLLHAEWDQDVPLELAQKYFLQLTSARYRRWTEIGEGTHLVLLEKHRMQTVRAIVEFFDESYTAE